MIRTKDQLRDLIEKERKEELVNCMIILKNKRKMKNKKFKKQFVINMKSNVKWIKDSNS